MGQDRRDRVCAAIRREEYRYGDRRKRDSYIFIFNGQRI
jgi:hypothetical protein